MAFVFSSCSSGAESLINCSSQTPITPPTSMNHDSANDLLRAAVEIVADRLYYTVLTNVPPRNAIRHGKQLHFFQIDTELLYWNFYLDFGPLNLGQLYRYCTKLNDLLREHEDKTIVYYSSTASAKRANATYLIGAWQVLYLNRTPEEALQGFRSAASATTVTTAASTTTGTVANEEGGGEIGVVPANPNASSPPLSQKSLTVSELPPFHDASPCACTYALTVLDCLRGLAKARMYGFFDLETFSVQEYEHFEQVENGDLNWIIKDRILAFAGPHFRRSESAEGHCTLTPGDHIPYFQKKNVDLVVRLNKRCYNEEDFRNADIRHVEQYYLDGSCPPMDVLNKVLEAFESVPPGKAFAVHCKAGLGRTGTCIGAYMMKHYKFSAAEAIGWMRICRPGMVIGPQQHFLQAIEQRMWHEGNMPSKATTDGKLLHITEQAVMDATVDSKVSPKSVTGMPTSLGFMNATTKDAVEGRDGQAEGLLARRNQGKTSSPRR